MIFALLATVIGAMVALLLLFMTDKFKKGAVDMKTSLVVVGSVTGATMIGIVLASMFTKSVA